jgi:iron complex transport system ATP-binding protein
MILDVDGVAFTYRSAPVIQEITFGLRPHQILAILGPNGVGRRHS